MFGGMAYLVSCRGFAPAAAGRPYIRSITAPDRPREASLLNRYDHSLPPTGEAEVKSLDGDFRVVRSRQLSCVAR